MDNNNTTTTGGYPWPYPNKKFYPMHYDRSGWHFVRSKGFMRPLWWCSSSTNWCMHNGPWAEYAIIDRDAGYGGMIGITVNLGPDNTDTERMNYLSSGVVVLAEITASKVKYHDTKSLRDIIDEAIKNVGLRNE